MNSGSAPWPISAEGPKTSGRRNVWKYIGFVTVSFVGLLIIVVAAAWFRIRLALPNLSGDAMAPGLREPATVTRDGFGVPTIRAQNQDDSTYALGYVHAQDRFFQMDLGRRRAGGELAELLGRAAIGSDREARVHDFRVRARATLQDLPENQQRLLAAYAAGVNAGLKSLRASPWEYAALRVTPSVWAPEDAILCILSLSMSLQDNEGAYEYSLWAVERRLGDAAFQLLASVSSRWDAPVDGSIPSGAKAPPDYEAIARRLRTAVPVSTATSLSFDGTPAIAFVAGSNSFAIAGAHTASGTPLIGGDMHLTLGVPNVWYRARLKRPGSPASDVVGVTIPGVPAVISGSNGQVAWRFTNAHVDTVDLVVVAQDAAHPSHYFGAGGTAKPFEIRRHTIQVRGGTPVEMQTEWTEWGPIIDKVDAKSKLALKWTLDDPRAIDLGLMGLESVQSVEEAIALAKTAGTPALNLLVVDRAGAVGWTLTGKLPRRAGHDGRLPVDGAKVPAGRTEFLPPAEYPESLNPPGGRLWTANNRMVGGEALAKLGDGRYDLGARARQIRDRLGTLEHATPRDFLAIQLDDEARFLTPWRDVLLSVLTPAACAEKTARGELREAVAGWTGRAETGSAGYYFLREWRENLIGVVFGDWARACLDVYPNFSPGAIRWEDALWQLVQDRPACLVNPGFASWEEMMLRAVDDAVGRVASRKLRVTEARWGRENRTRISHPLSRAFPAFVARFLDMPVVEQAGDHNLPRVAGPSFGASDRMVVSPGQETEGIFSMPGGQCGNPLSPYYRDQFETWRAGEALPLLPGPARHELRLRPAPAS